MPAATTILGVHARGVFDSRGVATLEVEVRTAAGFGRNAAPFGAPGSRGQFEAPAYGALGVEGAIRAVREELGPALVGMDAADLAACDARLRGIDGTANFDRIGGNTSSALSIAVARAAAGSLGVPLHRFLAGGDGPVTLPLPLGNVIGGGAHAVGPTPDMQEHLAIPIGARTLREAVEANVAVHHETGRRLAARDASFTGGTDDERAWAADTDDRGALEVLRQACAAVTATTGVRYRLGLDVAADRFWDGAAGVYRYVREGVTRTPAEQVDYLESLARAFDLGYIEDGFESTDYRSFAELRRRLGGFALVCGDDLLASNLERTARGVEVGSMDAMIVKVNQVGTLSDARATSDFARSRGVVSAISHRSGETEDDTIAHAGVAWGCALIKAGVSGGERLAKLNELLRIEEASPGSRLLAPGIAGLQGG